MKHFKHTTAATVAIAILVVAGCGGGGGSYGDNNTGVTPPVTRPPPPPPLTTDFTMFTRDLLAPARTNDTEEPVEIESIEFEFADDDNEAAYDDIITASES